MRRPFYEFSTSTKSPLAAAVLTRIRELYAIEAAYSDEAARGFRSYVARRSNLMAPTVPI